MNTGYGFEISSDLAATPDVVWRRVTEMAGVNDELMPLLRMTVPSGLAGRRIDDLPPGRPAGRSWLLLFGLVPVDVDNLTVAEHGPGHRFLERSTMATQALWQHERVLTPIASGCRVVDRLSWTGRLPGLGLLYRLVVPVLFRHRHRRLRRRFGTPGRSYD